MAPATGADKPRSDDIALLRPGTDSTTATACTNGKVAAHRHERQTPKRPLAPAPCVENIPAELQALARWLAWRYTWNPKKNKTGDWDKPPLNARTGQAGSSTNAATWVTFAEAIGAYQQSQGTAGALDGIGLAMAGEPGHDSIIGVDLDDCRDAETGDVQPWAQGIVERFATYTEVSPSMTGLRLFCRGRLDLAGGKLGARKGPIEVYAGGRYLTVTGRKLEDVPRTIERRQDAIDWLLAEHIHPPQKAAPPPPRPPSSAVDLDDAELLQRALRSKQGGKLKALLDGSADGYASDSEADLALCSMLRFWLQNDAGRIEAVVTASARGQRGKWAEREDYRQRTIAKALEGGGEVYEPGHARRSPEGRPGAVRHTPFEPEERNLNSDSTQSGPVDERPVIVITAEEKAVDNEAIRALAASPDLYQRAGLLVRMVRVEEEENGKHLRRKVGATRILLVEEPTLREELTEVARWVSLVKTKDGTKAVPAHPPGWAVKAIHKRGDWPCIRHLAGVVEAPALRPDGSVVDKPGYDRATGLLYLPAADYPPLPEQPTQDDARQAAQALLDLVAEFPFVSDSHKAAWLAAVLTVLARPAIAGPTPLFLFEAPTAGSGKTLLAELVGIVSTGRETPVSEVSDDNEEVRKALTAILLEGERLVLFDNASGSFGCKALDMAITGTTYKGRLLGKTQRTAEIPVDTVWMASGNNVHLRGDTHRRVIPCRIEPAQENPEERTFRIPDLKGHTRHHQPALVVAGLTILKAHALAGRPASKLPRLGSFEAWCDVVRDAVFWATGWDASATRDTILPESKGNAVLAAVLEGWAGLPGGKVRNEGITANEVLKLVKQQPLAYAALRDALMEWGKGGELPDSAALGRKLRAARGKVVGCWVLRNDTQNHDKVAKWWIEPVAGATAPGTATPHAGDEGNRGGSFQPFAGATFDTKNQNGGETSPSCPSSPAIDGDGWSPWADDGEDLP